MTCFRFEDGRSVHKWCVDNGICYNSFWTRMEKGLSFEQAIIEAKESKKRRWSHPRIYYKGTPLCKIFHIGTKEYSRVIRRLQRGLTIEQAMEGV